MRPDYKEVPPGYGADLSNFQPVLFDGWCGEPVGWGFKILKHLTPDRFGGLGKFEDVECLRPGVWVLVTRWLRPAEAEEKYGPVTNVDRGPRGGFRSITYGDKTFCNKIAAGEKTTSYIEQWENQ